MRRPSGASSDALRRASHSQKPTAKRSRSSERMLGSQKSHGGLLIIKDDEALTAEKNERPLPKARHHRKMSRRPTRRATRRESFFQYAAVELRTLGNSNKDVKTAPDSESVKEAGFWANNSHVAHLHGYSIILTLAAAFLMLATSQLEWGQHRDDNGKILPGANGVLWGLVLPTTISCSVCAWATVGQQVQIARALNMPSGSKYAAVTATAWCIVSAIGMGVLAALQNVLDPKFYGIDLGITMLIAAIASNLDFYARRRVFSRRARASVGDSALAQGLEETAKSGVHQKYGNFMFVIFAVILSTYQLALLPLYTGASTEFRFFIVLIIHPIVSQSTAILARILTLRSSLNIERLTLIEQNYAEVCVAEYSLHLFGAKQLFAVYERIMLMNVGSPEAAALAVVLSTMVGAIVRAGLVEIDTFFSRWFPRPPRAHDEVLQRIVWMCDVNQSAIAQFNAIMMSSLAFALFGPSTEVFALGYDSERSHFLFIFVHTIVQLLFEIIAQNMSMWADSEHGIPVKHYINQLTSGRVLVFHTFAGLASLCIALHAILRFPNMILCSSNNVCGCPRAPFISDFFTANCNSSAITANSVVAANQTVFPGDDDTIEVQPSTPLQPLLILIALFGSLLLLIVMAFFILFRRYSKKVTHIEDINISLNNKRKSLEAAKERLLLADQENQRLKKTLERAQEIVAKHFAEGGSLLDKFRVNHSDLNFGEPVGEGSFGTVFKATLFRRGVETTVAVKTVRMTRVSAASVKAFMSEIQIMAPLRHQNLVYLLGACWTDGPDKLCLVIEYCARGSLLDLLEIDDGSIKWETPLHAIVCGVADCFKYLHHDVPGEPLIHRDLKPANILITDEFVAKTADFGESRRFEQGDEYDGAKNVMSMTLVGTPAYLAPEVVRNGRYNTKVDVYAWGLVFLEVLGVCSGEHPKFVQDEFNLAGLASVVASNWRPTVPAEIGSKAEALIRKTWSDDPDERPNFIEIHNELEEMGTDVFSILGETRGHPKRRASYAIAIRDFASKSQAPPTLASQDKRFALWKQNSKLEEEVRLLRRELHELRNKKDSTDDALTTIQDLEVEVLVQARQLHRELPDYFGTRFETLPEYIGGTVALARLAKHCNEPVAWMENMFSARAQLDSDSKAQDILDRKLSLHSLPGCDILRLATFSSNQWIGLDAQGDIIAFERWGAIVPDIYVSRMDDAALENWTAYRQEARAMMIDALSRKTKRLVEMNVVIDAAGTRIAHRKLLRTMQCLFTSNANNAVPPIVPKFYIVRCSFHQRFIYDLVFRFGQSSRSALLNAPQNNVSFISGSDPFAQSAEFSTRFRRHNFPPCVGGNLTNVGDDEYCCHDVQLPSVTNSDDIWEQYEAFRMLTSSQYQRRGAKKKASVPDISISPESMPAERTRRKSSSN